MESLRFGAKYFGTFELRDERRAFIKKSYTYLLLSLAVCVVSVVVAIQTGLAQMLMGFWWALWIGIMATGFIAARVAHRPGLNLALLAVDAVVVGLALAATFARYEAARGPQSENIMLALLITGAIFLGTSAYVYITRKDFRPLYGVMFGLFLGIVAAFIFMWIFGSSEILAVLIAGAVGILGVMGVMGGTSELIHNEDMSEGSAIGAALMLFTALFNLFIAIFSILNILGGDD